jgi:rSAM/selenodomain-associated transferase 2
MSAPPRVSVVIPTLNEEARIERQLRRVAADAGWHEVIVVDGGSSDRTIERARAVFGVRVFTSSVGRGSQMNSGARRATGDVLLFLHADVELPPNALSLIAEALAAPEVVAGSFRTWTVAETRSGILAPLLHLADLRSRYSGLPYGDQALFVRATAFHRVGGFPEQPLMEDIELSRRLRRAGRIRIVRACVRVSGRRFLARPIYYFLLVNFLPLLYALRIAPTRLARWYGNPR